MNPLIMLASGIVYTTVIFYITVALMETLGK